MYRALGGTATSPASDPELYRVASYILATAVRFARDQGLDGVVTTSGGNRSRLNALVNQAGGRLLVTAPSRAEVCRRLRKVVPEKARREVCEAGAWWPRRCAAARPELRCSRRFCSASAPPGQTDSHSRVTRIIRGVGRPP